MAWLGVTAVVLLILGAFTPELGVILDRDLGRARLVLWIAGFALLTAAALLNKARGVRSGDIRSNGDLSDTSDLGGRDDHSGGNDGGGDGSQ